jgi:glutathione S-transferase
VDYLSIEAATAREGDLFLVLTAGVPGPWGEAAKGLFRVKGIPYTPVAQEAGGENAELREWTGRDNAPIVVRGDDPPRTGWAEILHFVERLAPAPRLIPADPSDRVRMLGLCHEICGEDGFGWNRRLMLLDQVLTVPALADSPAAAPIHRLADRYGYGAEAAAAAPGRVGEILRTLSERLRAQRDCGSRYFIGHALTALDIHWAVFAALLSPLPEAQCAMPKFLRGQYELEEGGPRGAADPILLEHRDAIYRDFLQLPLDF